jgi:diguanylate cyclase (GGDEF)-like protein/PAS domain S-box-containing protein
MTIFETEMGLPDQLKLLKTCISGMEQIAIITNNPKQSGKPLQILYVNEAFVQITGYSEQEALGKSPAMLHGPNTDLNELVKVRDAIKNEKSIKIELINYSKSGEQYWIELHLMPAGLDGQSCKHFIGLSNPISDKKAAEAEIYKLAYTDQLTQLPNRTVFNQRLENAIAISARKKIYGALLFLDLDDFKLINDTLGHDIGDTLLVAIAKRLQHQLRTIDTIARFGGDEFVMILDDLGSDLGQAEEKLEYIHEKLITAFYQPFYCDGNEIHSRASIGTTLFNGDTASQHELLQQADVAMYFAKNSGKNTVRFFNDDMQTNLIHRASVEKDLRRALKNDEFYLLYQPKVDYHNTSLGVEALIRWNHPQKGILLPQQFISIAEDSGLIIPIGQWALECACLFLNEWSALEVPKQCNLSVNISPMQFGHKDFVEMVAAALAKVPNSEGRLMLEITENTLIDNLHTSIEKINQLIECGVSFSLDDFGTGYSSLYYLKTLPIREIKIDQLFIKDIIVDDSNETIVSAVIFIADKLSLQVVAEGVETKEQAEFLQYLGVNIFQGLYFSEPLPEADAISYLLTH